MIQLMITRRRTPTGTPSGPRIRRPSLMIMGAVMISRIVMFEIVTSSSKPPSTVSSAKP